MGNGLVSDSLPEETTGSGSSASVPHKSYTEQFYELCPYYLSIGMTADEFWNQDCLLTKFYRKAHEYRQKRKNEELWLQGLYIYEALTDVAPVLHAFAKKDAKPLPYPNRPFPRTDKEAREREEADKKARYDQALAAMKARVQKKSKEV